MGVAETAKKSEPVAEQSQLCGVISLGSFPCYYCMNEVFSRGGSNNNMCAFEGCLFCMPSHPLKIKIV